MSKKESHNVSPVIWPRTVKDAKIIKATLSIQQYSTQPNCVSIKLFLHVFVGNVECYNGFLFHNTHAVKIPVELYKLHNFIANQKMC